MRRDARLLVQKLLKSPLRGGCSSSKNGERYHEPPSTSNVASGPYEKVLVSNMRCYLTFAWKIFCAPPSIWARSVEPELDEKGEDTTREKKN